MSDRKQKIVVFGVDWLGDTVFAVPAVQAIKASFPSSHITYILPAGLKKIILASGCINHVISFTEKPFLLGIFDWIRLIGELKRSGFDQAVFLHRSFTRALAAFIAGIPVRTGYSHPKRDILMTQLVPPPSVKEHRIQSYMRVAEAIGAKSSGTGISLKLEALSDSGFKVLAERHRLSMGEYAVLHPGANWDLKRWPAVSYAEVADFLQKNGKQVVFCGSDRDRELAEEITRIAGIQAVNMCGETSLEDLMQLIGNAGLLISNDSGPLHLAAGLNVPFIGIYGPTSPDATKPPESARSKLFHNRVGCEIPCYFSTCTDRQCLNSVRPSEVAAAALELARSC